MDGEEIFYQKPVSLADSLHDQILELIIKARDEDNMLLNEKKLSELFGCSKAPVREALIRLCSEGVLTSLPRVGYMVVRLRDEDVKEVSELRSYLELRNIRKITGHLDEAQVSRLKAQIRQASAKKNVDVWTVWHDNEEFHLLLAEFAGNGPSYHFLLECLNIEMRAYGQKHWKELNSVVDSVDPDAHTGIVNAILSGDPEKAAEVLSRDLGNVSEAEK